MTDAYRLPTIVRPHRYDLTITPDLDASTFTGAVSINLEITEATNTIVLHAKDLVVGVEELWQEGGTPGTDVALDPARDLVTITADRPLEQGAARLDLSFSGEISPGLLGFYRSTFVDSDGNERALASTQFEAPHARAAFPCFDEPEFKAVFAVTLVVPDDMLALSNGPETSREVEDGVARVTFGETIPMSTYLVAWVVGPLEITPPVDAGGVALRVAYPPGKAHLTQFALDVGAHALRFFADYYGIPYPGEKCDFVAIPDFAFGAMENLGLVTYRETRLLLDPEDATFDEMTGAAQTIVHEVAHMWFGDLVTMKWWNGIWLNEAFATFMEHLGVDTYRPDWKTWDDFAVGRALALNVDALENTRTVEYEVRTPEDADGMFDTLTYQKGGSVLRMLEQWLGADAFRAGVRLYLDRYKLANTETTDLWDALEEATGRPVRRIMDSWIFQPGYPVVQADAGRLDQHRFTYAGRSGDERYGVPVLARVHTGAASETQSLLLFDEAIAIDTPADALVVLNAGGHGFYRVAYPDAWRDRLLDADVLGPQERFTIIDDLWASVIAGDATAAEFLACARRFSGERDAVVWRGLAARLREAARFVDSSAIDRYHEEVRAIVGPTLTRLGWEPRPDDDVRERQLRGIVFGVMGATVGDPEVIGRAREIVARPDGVDADVAAAGITVVASAGSDDDFDNYERRATGPAKNPQDQLRYLYALGDFPTEQLVLRGAALALTHDVRAQNVPFLLQRALRNHDHGPVAWAFVRDNWDALHTRLSGPLMARMIEGVSWIVDGPTVDDITRFIDAHPVPESARTIAQHVERMQLHRAAADRERERFANMLLSSS
jgi:puromycin-sensitive aminopeptidase